MSSSDRQCAVYLRGVVTDGVTPPREGERHDVVLVYRTDDPYAVTMRVLQTEWVFSRELFLDPEANVVTSVAGQKPLMGDVIVITGSDATTIILNPGMDEEAACVVVETAPLQTWLHQTLSIMPRGNEQVDVDSWITKIMKAAS